jgi:hypothetical protein
LAIRRNVDRHRAPADTVRVPVSGCHVDRGRYGIGARGLNASNGLARGQREEPSTRQRGGVGAILLRPTVEQVLPDVVYERGDKEDRNHPAGHEDEDLTALAFPAISG